MLGDAPAAAASDEGALTAETNSVLGGAPAAASEARALETEPADDTVSVLGDAPAAAASDEGALTAATNCVLGGAPAAADAVEGVFQAASPSVLGEAAAVAASVDSAHEAETIVAIDGAPAAACGAGALEAKPVVAIDSALGCPTSPRWANSLACTFAARILLLDVPLCVSSYGPGLCVIYSSAAAGPGCRGPLAWITFDGGTPQRSVASCCSSGTDGAFPRR